MATQFTIQQVILFSKISQYLSQNDKAISVAFRSGSLIQRQPQLLYMEGELLENMYTLNPNGSTIRTTAEYVLSLCGRYLNQAQNILNNLLQNPPIITGPSNQTVGVGVNAVFSIAVTSSLSYTVQWYDSFGNPIVGATGLTYTLLNAQITDSGKTFYAKATNAAGVTTSTIASLTVTASIIAKWWYGDTDPFPQLSIGNDTLTYQISQTITHNAAIAITYPLASTNNKFLVLKYPDTENDKMIWKNTDFSLGTIPDSAMRAIFIQNGFKYIVSRTALSLDASATTLTYS